MSILKSFCVCGELQRSRSLSGNRTWPVNFKLKTTQKQENNSKKKIHISF